MSVGTDNRPASELTDDELMQRINASQGRPATSVGEPASSRPAAELSDNELMNRVRHARSGLQLDPVRIPGASYLGLPDTIKTAQVPEQDLRGIDTTQGIVPAAIQSLSTMERMDAARVIQNAIPAFGEAWKVFGHMISSPIETATGIHGILAGAGKTIGSKGRINDEHTQMFDQVVDALYMRYGPRFRETLVEDPFGILMDVAGIIGTGGALTAATTTGKVSRIARTVSQASKLASPVGFTVGAIKAPVKVARAGADAMGKHLLPVLFSIQTGKDVTAIRGMFEAGRKGGQTDRVAVQALRDQLDMDQVVGTLQKAKNVLRDNRKEEYRRLWKKGVKDGSAQYDRGDFRKTVLDWMSDAEDWGLRPIIIYDAKGRPKRYKRTGNKTQDFPRGKIELEPIGGSTNLTDADMRMIRNAATIALDWTDNTVQGLDNLQVKLGRYIAKMKGAGRAATAQLQDLVENFMKRLFPGTKAAKAYYRKQSRLIRMTEKMLSEAVSDDRPDITIGKLMQAAGGDDASSKIRRSLLERIDAQAKTYLHAAATGAVMGEAMPGGIHARNLLIKGLGVGGPLVAGSMISPFFYLGLPFASPRVTGRFMRFLGAKQKHVVRFEKWLDQVRLLSPGNLLTNYASIATTLTRLREAGVQIPPAPEVQTKYQQNKNEDGVARRLLGKAAAPDRWTLNDAQSVSHAVLGKRKLTDPEQTATPYPILASDNTYTKKFAKMVMNAPADLTDVTYQFGDMIEQVTANPSSAIDMAELFAKGSADFAWKHGITGGPLSTEGRMMSMVYADVIDTYKDPNRPFERPISTLLDAVDLVTFGKGGVGVAGTVMMRSQRFKKTMDAMRAAAKEGEVEKAIGHAQKYASFRKQKLGAEGAKKLEQRLNKRFAVYDAEGELHPGIDRALAQGETWTIDGKEYFHLPMAGDVLMPHGRIEDIMATAYDVFGDNPTQKELLKAWEIVRAHDVGSRVGPTPPDSVLNLWRAIDQDQLDQMLGAAIAKAPPGAMTWYKDVGDLVVQGIGEKNMVEFTHVFGITSAQNPVEWNMLDTFWVMRQAREWQARGGKFGGKEFADFLMDEKVSDLAPLNRRRLDYKSIEGAQGPTSTIEAGQKAFLDTKQADKISSLYADGIMLGNQKTKTYSLSLWQKLFGGGDFFPYTVLDQHMAKIFGQFKMKKGGKAGGKGQREIGDFDSDSYRVAQYMIAKAGQKYGISPDEAQAVLWWKAKFESDAATSGLKNWYGRMGRDWPWEPGSPESAMQATRRALGDLVSDPTFDRNNTLIPGFEEHRVDLENIAMPMSVWYARIVDDPESLIPANMYRGQSMPLYGRVASGYGPDNPYDPTPIIGEDARRTKMLDRLGLGDR